MAHEWVVVRHCGSLQEAEFLKSVLETEGIEVKIPDEYTLGVDPGLTNAFGGVRLMSPAADATRAEEILVAAEPR
jgi:hypothetical protein